MTKHATEILAQYEAVDRMLVRAGWPATSPWWMREIRRFYTSGRRRWAVRAGRRGGKSSTLCRVAYVEARWGLHKIPPGDRGWVMFISKDRDEAAQRLHTIDEIARVVGDVLDVKGDERTFRDRRTGFKVYTASIAGVSGPTSIMVIGDEVSKWRDADTGSNPSKEVIASAMPTIATMPEGRAVWSSSPLGLADSHAKMISAGDNKSQVVSIGATWECNPMISRNDTRVLEPDERIWAREYAAIPQAGALGCFDVEDIEAAFEPRGD